MYLVYKLLKMKLLAEINENSFVEIFAKVAGLAGLSLTVIIFLMRTVIEENVLNTLPKASRKSVFNRIIAVTAVISILALLIWLFLENKKIDVKQQENVRVITREDSISRQNIQNSFKVIGVTLEGKVVDLLIDSQYLSKDWNNWFGNAPEVLISATSIYDSLFKLNTLFGKRDYINYDDQSFEKITILKNGRKIKTIKKKSDSNGLPATDPNAFVEAGAFTPLEVANKIFGFERGCFFGGDSDNKSRYNQKDCQIYLTQKGLDWLAKSRNTNISETKKLYNIRYRELNKDNQIADEDNQAGNEDDLYNDNTFEYLEGATQIFKFYSYIANGHLPSDFIKVKNLNEDDCNSYSSDAIKLSISTPLFCVHTLVLKNLSSATITINKIKFSYTDFPSLRDIKKEKILTRKTAEIIKNIKLSPHAEILVPVSITFRTIEDVKPPDGTIREFSTKKTYYWGKAYYLDTLIVNNSLFSILQGQPETALQTMSDGKTFTVYGSCPYVYTLEKKQKKYLLEDHIIYKLNSPTKKGYDTLQLFNPSSEIMLKEIDDEQSFIDEIFLLEVLGGKLKFFSCSNEYLNRKDNNYLKLIKGDEKVVHFDNFHKLSGAKYYLISYGYYVPKVKSKANTPPKFVSKKNL